MTAIPHTFESSLNSWKHNKTKGVNENTSDPQTPITEPWNIGGTTLK